VGAAGPTAALLVQHRWCDAQSYTLRRNRSKANAMPGQVQAGSGQSPADFQGVLPLPGFHIGFIN
jgi:hypothetical protein